MAKFKSIKIFLIVFVLIVLGCQGEKHPNNIKKSPKELKGSKAKESKNYFVTLDDRDPQFIRGIYENNRYGIQFRLPRDTKVVERKPSFMVQISNSGKEIFSIEYKKLNPGGTYKQQVVSILNQRKGPRISVQEVVLSAIEIGITNAYEVFFNDSAKRRINAFYEGTSSGTFEIYFIPLNRNQFYQIVTDGSTLARSIVHSIQFNR